MDYVHESNQDVKSSIKQLSNKADSSMKGNNNVAAQQDLLSHLLLLSNSLLSHLLLLSVLSLKQAGASRGRHFVH